VRKPGTHIYNFIIPLTVLSAITITMILEKAPGYIKYLWAFVVSLVLIFLFYQSYVVFLDHKREYPWEQKTLIDLTSWQDKWYDNKRVSKKERVYKTLTTPKYTLEQKLPLFGFPHKRHWNEINNFVNTQNELNSESMGYITNEVKTISEWYMDAEYSNDRPFYVIGVKKPLSFVADYKFPQIGRKYTMHEIQNEFGETIVRIYKAEVRDED
jgi:hypothetical protein